MFAVLHNQPIQSDNDSIFQFLLCLFMDHSYHNYSTKNIMVFTTGHSLLCNYLCITSFSVLRALVWYWISPPIRSFT